jgi:hypothetical protein
MQEEFLKMMMRKDLSEMIADISGRPMTTIENGLIPKLQAAGLLPSLRKGDDGVDASYKVNVLLGTILDRQHGVSPAEAVRHWRSLTLTGASEDITHSFGIDTTNAGAALDSILERKGTWSSRSPILAAMTRGDIRVTVEFRGESCMVVIFHGPKRNIGTLTFGSADADGRVERIVRVPYHAFERLAA